MRQLVYLVYGVVVIVVCTWVNASDLEQHNSSRGWSSGGGRGGSWWSGGHK